MAHQNELEGRLALLGKKPGGADSFEIRPHDLPGAGILGVTGYPGRAGFATAQRLSQTFNRKIEASAVLRRVFPS